jgi:16S rRNA (cytosine967-C5)-methyltransferase
MSRHREPDTIPRQSPGARRATSRRAPAQQGVRAVAAWTLERVLASQAPADGFLAAAAAQFDERDRALLHELVLGSLRWLRRLDHVITAASHRAFGAIEPELRSPLRVAAYQLLFLDRVPAHAVVDEAVERALQVTHRGGASFVNAVLRRIARSPRLADWPVDEPDAARRLAIESSHPDFLVERWLERFGRLQTLALLRANNQPKPLHLLAFRDRGGRELLAEALIDEGLEVEPSALSPLGLVVRAGNPLSTDAFRRGDFYVADEGGQATVLLPPPRPEERVLDVAAAPGGKAFALLASQPDLRLTLADRSLARLGRLRDNAIRLRRRLPLAVADAACSAFAGGFDRVVVDLPCSGTGTLRKHPELKWRISEEEIGRLAEQALQMLAGAATQVRARGLLVAITCSLEREENEAVTERLRGLRPEFVPLPLGGRLPAALEPWIAGDGCWRLPTGGDHDGFTVQVLTRGADP